MILALQETQSAGQVDANSCIETSSGVGLVSAAWLGKGRMLEESFFFGSKVGKLAR